MSKMSIRLFLAIVALSLWRVSVFAQDNNTIPDIIIANATADNIDLSVLDFLPTALEEINMVYENASQVRKRDTSPLLSRQSGSLVDVHNHIVPDWYRALVPVTGGNPTPSWNVNTALSFMASEGIGRSILSFSAPGPNVFPGNQVVTIALARLMNEQSAAFARAYPDKFTFYAVVPLPYASAAITEAQYALGVLGAAGIILTSNIEGMYLGNSQFQSFFSAINQRSGKQIIFIHPTTPTMKCGNQLIEANPTPYISGSIEFYFETARTLEDLTLTQTLQQFTNINYVIPHLGGAFPAVIDRMLKSVPTIYDSSMQIYSTRIWWDSAGPTYYHQISGLLGYGIPKSQLVFGSDYPYAPLFTQAGSLAAIQNCPLLTAADKTAIFSSNAVNLFGSKLPG